MAAIRICYSSGNMVDGFVYAMQPGIRIVALTQYLSLRGCYFDPQLILSFTIKSSQFHSSRTTWEKCGKTTLCQRAYILDLEINFDKPGPRDYGNTFMMFTIVKNCFYIL